MQIFNEIAPRLNLRASRRARRVSRNRTRLHRIIAGVRKNRLSTFNQTAYVSGWQCVMTTTSISSGLYPAAARPFSRLPGWQPFAELLVLAWKSPIAGVEQNQLLPGIHKRWNVGMFEPLGIDVVGAGSACTSSSRSIRAILRVQTSKIAFSSRTVATSNPPSLKR